MWVTLSRHCCRRRPLDGEITEIKLQRVLSWTKLLSDGIQKSVMDGDGTRLSIHWQRS